jgi:AraC-like DNA-binding protein
VYYGQVQPNPILKQFVQCHWAVRAESRTLPTLDHGVIPGGYVDIVFNVGDRIYMSDSGGIWVDRARGFVAGPFDRLRRFRAEGKFEFLGVRFHLGRVPFFSRLSLGDVRNRTVLLDAVLEDQGLRGELKALERRLAQVSGTAQRIAYVERFLMKFLRYGKEPDSVVTRAHSLIEESKGQISVEALSSALSVSDRQLERKFTQHVGLSPKALCRVTRFQQVKSLLENTREPSGCDLAYACGYSDQTHLIREFRLFTGQTPVRYERVQPVGFFLYDNQPND